MTRKSVFFFSAIAAFIVSILSGAGIYFWVMNSKSEIVVPISANEIKESRMITENDIMTVKINPNAASNSIVYNAKDLVGKYSLRNMGANEYFYRNWISPDYARRLAERVRYCAVPAPTTQLLSVNGEIKEDDFVRITIITGNEGANVNENYTSGIGQTSVKLIEPPELSAVRVLGIYDGSGIDINAKRELITNADGSVDPNSSLPQGSFIIFDCTDIQRALILQAQNSGTLQLIILPEADQKAERIKWGLVQDDEEDKYGAGSIDVGIDYSKPANAEATPGSAEDAAQQEARRQELINAENAKTSDIIQQAAEQQGIPLNDVDLSNTAGSLNNEGSIPKEKPNQQG